MADQVHDDFENLGATNAWQFIGVDDPIMKKFRARCDVPLARVHRTDHTQLTQLIGNALEGDG